jgi:hypothetical protein
VVATAAAVVATAAAVVAAMMVTMIDGREIASG